MTLNRFKAVWSVYGILSSTQSVSEIKSAIWQTFVSSLQFLWFTFLYICVFKFICICVLLFLFLLRCVVLPMWCNNEWMNNTVISSGYDNTEFDRLTMQLSARGAETRRRLPMSVAWWSVALSGSRVQSVAEHERRLTYVKVWQAIIKHIESCRHVETSRAGAANLPSLLYCHCQYWLVLYLTYIAFLITYIIVIMFVYSKLSKAISDEDAICMYVCIF